jgi:hypothetical protein
LGFLVACGPSPLVDTYQSPQALAAAVLEALVVRDRTELERLALSEQEFRDHVWPSLPAARPERNLPVTYVWGDLHQKSQGALTQVLQTYGGRRYELVGVDFADRTDYGAYRVHREATLRVRDADGAATTIRVCGSMIEKDGAWKVFSYVVDD